ncbi:hypothetical protein QQ045_006722 [Rhodiola kirilowii]
MANSFILSVMTMMNEEDDVPTRRRPNLPRQRESRGQNLMDDYFVEHPIFPQQDFCRRYRMSINLFNRIKFNDTKIDRMQGQLEEKDTKIDRMQVQLEEKDTKIDRMQGQFEENDTKIDRMQGQLEENDTKIDRMQEQ